MKRVGRVFIRCACLCVGACLLLTACASSGDFITPERLTPQSVAMPDNSPAPKLAPPMLGDAELVADGTKVALYGDTTAHTIAVLDKCTGYVWNSAPDESRIDPENMNRIWVRYMNSLASVRAFDSANEDVQIERSSSEDRNNETTMTVVDGGLDVDFYFFEMDIAFSMTIRLKDDVLVVSLEDDTIEERGSYHLTSIELLPFFGFYNDGDTGYTLLPDGSGTLVHFSNSNGAMDRASYSLDVYSPYIFDADSYEDAAGNDRYSLSFPLFGIKNGNNALLVHSVTGAEDASVNTAPSGCILPFGRTGFEYWYRYSYTVPTTNIEMDTGTANSAGVKAKYVTRIEEERIRCDRRQEYVFLRGNTANYSGMANAYQTYLIENGLIRQSPVTELPLSLNVLCGVTEDGIFGEQLVEMTTFDDVAAMEQTLTEAGVDNVDITLLGWAKGGYEAYVKSFRPAAALGGSSLFDQFATGDKRGYRYFLDLNPFVSDEASPNKKNLVLSGNGSPVSYQAGKRHYYSAEGMLRTVTNVGKNTTMHLALNGLPGVLVRDVTKQATRETILQTLKQESERRQLTLAAPNAYALAYADRISDLPIKSSQLRFYDEDVPFYQLVINGLIPYAGTAMSQDNTMQVNLLKLVEYGASPCFEVTGQSTVLLKQSNFSAVNTVNFHKQQETILNTIVQLRKILKPVESHRMIAHSKLADGVYKVTYDNGWAIYINYNSTAVTCEGVTVDPVSCVSKATNS